MANGNTAGSQKLVDRIISDAMADAQATKAQADENCAAILAGGKEQAARLAEKNAAQREAAVNGILERSRTNAELEARKNLLAERRQVIDEVFAAAYEKMCALPESERAAICKKLLLQEADGGETVMAAEADKALLAGLLPEVNGALTAAGKAPLKAEIESGSCEYGFVLVGDGYEKDCSFQAILRDARALEETKVAGILFD